MPGPPRISISLPTSRAWSCCLSTSPRPRPSLGASTTESKALAAISPAAKVPSSITYRVASLALATLAASVFRPPLEGKGWLVVNGCCGDTGAHRGAIQSINGRLFDSQRFAIDFMQADVDGRLVIGDPANVRSWVGYGARVRAAAAGRVVAARNDLSDQMPGSLPDPQTITVDNVDGNFVVLDHGQGLFTFYAHLQRKSVQVVQGDRVAAGQELGRLGNTGNTSAPHLHFPRHGRPIATGIRWRAVRLQHLRCCRRRRRGRAGPGVV